MDNQIQSPPSTPSSSFKINEKYIIIFIIILALISFSSTFYLLARSNKNKPIINRPEGELVPSPSPTNLWKSSSLVSPQASSSPTPVPQLGVDPTASWSTYLSTQYNFSIKYPNNWAAKNISQQDPKILEYVVFNPNTSSMSTELGITLSYTIRTYQDALSLDPQQGISIIVGSTSATQKTQRDSNGNVSINIIIPYSTNTIILYAQDKYKDIFNLMLSTVKLAK
ncbi:hypothetical protein M1146_02555 [Patescibacteria group bacterium]|nr:hypothetical protein [Patescibacteria group bacterium]